LVRNSHFWISKNFFDFFQTVKILQVLNLCLRILCYV
jgi:hypothetical protein